MFKILIFLCAATLVVSNDLLTPQDFIKADVKNLVEGRFVEYYNAPNVEGFIVGGTQATTGQFRYMASLRSIDNIHFCGGAIISSNAVLSAAHCTINRVIGNTIVVVGTISRTAVGTRLTLTGITNHPNYNANTVANDISILHTSNIPNNNNIGPIALVTGDIPAGTVGVVTGWGLTANPGNLPVNLQFLHMATLHNLNCQDRVGGHGQIITSTNLCAGGIVGQGVCSGDSGGPFAIGNSLAGIVSWMIPCARGFADVFTRVPSFNIWIQNNI